MAEVNGKKVKIIKHVKTGDTHVFAPRLADKYLESKSWIEIDEKGKEIKKSKASK
jgi:hypothetical protein